MKLSLQHFDNCPNWQVAQAALLQALALVGIEDVEVTYRVVSTQEDAEAMGFRGSPTLLLDGVDPFADPDAPAGLSCRVYRTDTGLAGTPTVKQLVAVLNEAQTLRSSN
ncbi:thioredoxin family protein [Klenkia sp. PcliD-1-E]|uniref:thioredoxin family protein n=1 Tax=Klenkia sp. PcliD-1-E TaxID=2954492 RepID=UPI002098483C|nr:thioredoxin family protein [Klenkia sp. PcliD-1-E]MCO7220406.1 thioredoxin family protein [Klenkia sp. PcliD-1-E]